MRESRLLSDFRLVPMTHSFARDIAVWRYTGELATYNVPVGKEDEAVAGYLRTEFHYVAAVDGNDSVVGFCCYGLDAQVSGGDYSIDALDVGLGLHPNYLGNGLGAPFLDLVLANPAIASDTRPFRATIASFNRRSRRVFEKSRFVEIGVFTVKPPATRDFVIMMKQNGNTSLGDNHG